MTSERATNPDHVAQAFRSETLEIVAQRVPLGFGLFLLFTGVASAFEWFYYPERWRALVAAYAAYVLIALFRTVALRLAPVWAARSTPLATNAFGGCLITYFAWVDGNAEILVILLLMYLYGVALIYPWGWRRQALGTVGVPIMYLLALHVGVTPTQPPLSGVAALLAAYGMAVFGAGLLDSHRLTAYRDAAALQRINDEKNEILGMAAHDLRNPLGAIHAYSELLRDTEAALSTEERGEIIERIGLLSTSMLQLVSDLLDISAIEAGKLSLDLQETDLVPLVQANVAVNSLLARRKRVALAFHNREAGSVARVDRRKMGQVLDNLITNAVKFSPTGAQVTVQLYQDDGAAVIAVRDEGPGIPAQEREKLFRPFYRAGTQGAAGEAGTGLGLAIVRRIVEAHGGRVWVESEINKGSTFYVSVPSVAGEVSQQP
jgi:signal transduction histidine kinase